MSDEGIERLDYDYLKSRNSISGKVRRNKIRIADVTDSLRRGNIERAIARKEGVPVFHTTDFSRCRQGKFLKVPMDLQVPASKHGKVYFSARRGDILIGRVGRNYEKQICMVTGGEVLLTDCVFCLRVTPKKRQAVFKALTSEKGRAWLRGVGRGVGARYLSTHSLLDFPL